MMQDTKCYEATIDSAVETASNLLDLEGGKFVAAIIVEMLCGLLEAGNTTEAMAIAQKLMSVAEVVSPEWGEQDSCEDSTWLGLWINALVDALEALMG